MMTAKPTVATFTPHSATAQRRWMLRVAALALGVLALTGASSAAPATSGQDFDHLTTGFELIGRHRDLPCESCHVNAIFKGTPRDCAACHGVGTEVRATAKPANHILSSNRCEACHTPIAFSPAVKFDHTEARGSCSTCHNGVQAQGKGPTHIDTDLECDACHSTIGWAGALFTHANVTGNCASCHDGISATGMPQTHIPTDGAACESCHSPTNFVSWAGAQMDHTVVTALTCATCHEAGMSFIGVTIVTRPPAPHPTSGDCAQCHFDTISFTNGTGMPPDHIPTTQTCTLCHANPADYSVYAMNHQGIVNNCAQCHATGSSFANMAPPVLKVPPTDHVNFGTAACETCHAPADFNSFMFTNASGTAPPAMVHSAVAGVACAACHASGLSFVGAPPTVAPPGNHIPFGTANCESCHAPANFTSFMFTNASGTAPPSMVHSVVSSTPCSTCHEAGMPPFAGTPPIKTRPPAPHAATGECSNCHASTVSFTGAGTSVYPVNHIPLPNGASANCAACHSNSADFTSYTMDHSVVTRTCAVCHAAGLSFANMPPLPLKAPMSTHIQFGTATCDSCHSPANFSTFVFTNASGTAPPAMVHGAVTSIPCATCHGRNKTDSGTPATVVEGANHVPVGTATCQSCHSSSNFTTFVIANASGTAPPSMVHSAVSGVACITCHGTSAGPSFVPPVKTFSSSHIPTGTIACESCHSPTTFNNFVIPNTSGTAPPAMVHSAVTSLACSTCHEAGKSFTPPVVLRPPYKNNNPLTPHVAAGACNTCHFNTTSFKGATDLPGNHIPLPAADNNNCALCHTTGNYSLYVMNHVNIVNNCAQCHAKGLSFANIAAPALVQPDKHVPFGSAACETCHSASNFNSFVINNASGTAPPSMVHSAVSGVACITCHGTSAGPSFVPPVKTFSSSHIPTGTIACESCHSPTAFNNFVIPNTSGTAPPSMVHGAVPGVACITCHGTSAGPSFVPPVKTFASSHIPTGTIACEKCHSPTAFNSFVIPNTSGTAPPSMVHSAVTSIVCSSCHEKGKTFTPPVLLRPVNKANGSPHVTGGECSTCHFNTTSFKGATDLPTNHIPLPAADNNNCALCHTTGNYSLYVMNHVNIVNNCAQCHAYGLSFANIAAPELVQPPAGPTGHIPSNRPNGTMELACELCHTPTVFTTFAGTIMRHAPVRGMTCMSCHELGMKWKTNTGKRLWVRDGANHYKGRDCGGSGCHSTRDKRALRPGTGAVQPGIKASGAIVPRAPTVTGAATSRPGGFDHRRIVGQTCVSCHDQASGMGKPANHLDASNNCASCHSTLAWLPVARVDHSEVKGTCANCHNGTIARARSSRHIASASTCETCHTTNAWTPARFDHGAVAPHTCTSCHDAVHASGKPATHIATSGECDTCHGTLAWKPARLDHTALTASCATCHNGASATGMPTTHMAMQRDCAQCHSYPDWTLVRFTHTSANYPGDHSVALVCSSCHTTNTDKVPYPSAADAGSCGACHAKDFKADLHVKTAAGAKYTASELRNCSGACHVYSDATQTTVDKLVPGPYHRVTDGAFKH